MPFDSSNQSEYIVSKYLQRFSPVITDEAMETLSKGFDQVRVRPPVIFSMPLAEKQDRRPIFEPTPFPEEVIPGGGGGGGGSTWNFGSGSGAGSGSGSGSGSSGTGSGTGAGTGTGTGTATGTGSATGTGTASLEPIPYDCDEACVSFLEKLCFSCYSVLCPPSYTDTNGQTIDLCGCGSDTCISPWRDPIDEDGNPVNNHCNTDSGNGILCRNCTDCGTYIVWHPDPDGPPWPEHRTVCCDHYNPETGHGDPNYCCPINVYCCYANSSVQLIPAQGCDCIGG